MTAWIGLIFTFFTTAIGAVIWFVRLEGRVNMNSSDISDLKKDTACIRDENARTSEKILNKLDVLSDSYAYIAGYIKAKENIDIGKN